MSPAPAAPPRVTLRTVVAVAALAVGGFAIGTTEFVTMGVLPDIADGVGVSIPSAGHLVSFYALGRRAAGPASRTCHDVWVPHRCQAYSESRASCCRTHENGGQSTWL